MTDKINIIADRILTNRNRLDNIMSIIDDELVKLHANSGLYLRMSNFCKKNYDLLEEATEMLKMLTFMTITFGKKYEKRSIKRLDEPLKMQSNAIKESMRWCELINYAVLSRQTIKHH